MFVTTASIGDTILSALWGFLLTIDGLIYNLICYVTEIFNSLVKLNVFTNEGYNDIVSRIYIVLGLIMLFVLAYSLLKAIINPENFSKGETSFSKLIGNTVSSLIIIAILPTVFSVAFNIQNSLVNQGTIYKIILGNDSNDTSTDEIKQGGRDIAYYTFTSFFYENDQSDGENTDSSENSYGGITTAVKNNGDSFTKFSTLSEKVVDKSITYMFPISTIAGIVILYILLNFCFDVAVRVVKLAFYQIIAPIPVMCRIIPGGKMKDVFSKWLKQVISLFVEVFIRMAAIAFGVKFVQIIVENKDSLNIDASTGARRIVMALLIMALVIFIKQIPKIIGDMFGIDTAGMKLGLMDKLAAGGALAAGAFLGGGVKTMAGNAVNKFGNKKNWLTKDGKLTARSVLKNLGAGVASGAAGGLSGAFRSGKAGLKAKNFADMKKASADGSKAAIEKRVKRGNYIAQHSAGKGFVNDVVRSMGGHISDAARGVTNWAGYKNLDQMQAENVAMDEIMSARNTFNDNTDAYITKEMAKWDENSGKGIVGGLTFYDAKELRTKENALAKARVDGVGVAEAEKAFNDAMRNARAKVQTNVAKSQKDWANLSDGERAKLSGLRVDVTKYVGAVNKNAALDAVQSAFNSNDNKSGIANPKDFNFENGLDFTKDEFKDLADNMEDLMKIKKGDNNVEIAMRLQTEPENKK